ncbi:MAG: DUF4783 domain-containing protein [Bacteroidota bacterium]
MQLLIIIFLSFTLITPSDNTINDVAVAVKTGNAKEVAKFFTASIDLKIPDKEDVFSKSQAELILKDFFSKNPIKSFTIVHKGTSKNGDQFAIGTYETTTGKKFRTYFLFKKEETKFLIQQLRFELQDE